MSHTIRNKAKLLNRVRRIRGQVESVERALENEDGCSDILQRIAAARGAMNALMAEVLEQHVLEHVLPPGAASKGSRRAADELIGVVRSYLK
ncbi:MAG: metal/formaldehyde-sensitive transcriptional repressor [Candidatus Eremiobacteraeota bacterium]|nr:metal/formaldehyde-sensitive transcriptional repressor [Candidatus Eremiobacteraeota bacterium]